MKQRKLIQDKDQNKEIKNNIYKSMSKKDRFQEQRGITLLSLIITIILLLIVSGVTLNAALGDNGLLKKSKEAINKSKLARNRGSNKNGLTSSIHRCRISRREQAK